jgi:hypothetical protein
MRRLLTIVLAAGVAALAAVLIRRLLFPEDPFSEDQSPEDQHGSAAVASQGTAAPSQHRTPWQAAPTSSGGGPTTNSPSRDELYKEAARLGIKGRSKMNKRQLQEAVEAARTGGSN